MNPSKFDDVVERRTNERAQAAINKFRLDVYRAAREFLLIGNGPSYDGENSRNKQWRKEFRDLLGILASDNTQRGWPSILWQREREAVTKELLSIMDEMQRALVAPPPDTTTDCSPAEATTEDAG